MAWRNALQRCFNPLNERFSSYGGRGITMAPEWRSSFEAFIRHMGACQDGLTLDRIDVDGHYEPGNCRWAPNNEQARNKRGTLRAGAQTLKEISAKRGINYYTLRAAQRRGEDPRTFIPRGRR